MITAHQLAAALAERGGPKLEIHLRQGVWRVALFTHHCTVTARAPNLPDALAVVLAQWDRAGATVDGPDEAPTNPDPTTKPGVAPAPPSLPRPQLYCLWWRKADSFVWQADDGDPCLKETAEANAKRYTVSSMGRKVYEARPAWAHQEKP